jgi:hypothetical protein
MIQGMNAAGHPVVMLCLQGLYDLVKKFFL